MTKQEENNLVDFENYCMNCDHFPGDGTYEKREYYNPPCPFKEKFLNGELNGNSEWKKIGCKNFWD